MKRWLDHSVYGRNRLRAARVFGLAKADLLIPLEESARRNRLRAAHVFGVTLIGILSESFGVAIAFERRMCSDLLLELPVNFMMSSGKSQSPSSGACVRTGVINHQTSGGCDVAIAFERRMCSDFGRQKTPPVFVG